MPKCSGSKFDMKIDEFVSVGGEFAWSKLDNQIDEFESIGESTGKECAKSSVKHELVSGKCDKQKVGDSANIAMNCPNKYVLEKGERGVSPGKKCHKVIVWKCC